MNKREEVAELIRGILANIDEIVGTVEGDEDWFCDGYPFPNSFDEVGASLTNWYFQILGYNKEEETK